MNSGVRPVDGEGSTAASSFSSSFSYGRRECHRPPPPPLQVPVKTNHNNNVRIQSKLEEENFFLRTQLESLLHELHVNNELVSGAFSVFFVFSYYISAAAAAAAAAAADSRSLARSAATNYYALHVTCVCRRSSFVTETRLA